MKKRKCYQKNGPFTHPRGFLSEVILSPHDRVINSPFYDSWSDSCLKPGLRRVLHQLCDYRTSPDGHGCGGRHDYFSDILCTVSGLDNEFNKLEHFLSTRKRIEPIRNEKLSTISADDMSYLDFTAKSLLELIACLKHELTVQVKFGSGDKVRTVYQTNKLVNTLEKKLYDLLGKLEEFKVDGGRNVCCKRCSEHMSNMGRPLRSRLNLLWKNNVSKPSDQERCVRKVWVDYLTDNKDPEPLNRSGREHKIGSKHQNRQARQSKCSTVNNTQNYNLPCNNNLTVPSCDKQWVKSRRITSKTRKDLQNTFMGACGRLNGCKVKKQCPNSNNSEKLQTFYCVQNKNTSLSHNLSRNELNSMVHPSLKTPPHCQRNTSRRKRAGKDNSVIFDISVQKPYSYSNNRRFRRQIYIKGKSKQPNNPNKTSQPKNKKKMISNQVSFDSTHSDQTTTTGDDVSEISTFLERNLKINPQKSKQNINRPSENRVGNIRTNYRCKSRNQENKRDQKFLKTNKIKLKRSSDSFSSQEHISSKQEYVPTKPNIKIESRRKNSSRARKNERFMRVNKSYTPLSRTNNTQLQRKTKRCNNNITNEKKYKNPADYPNKWRGYRNQRLRSGNSKVGNFLKRVRNNLSKIRIFSSKPTNNSSDSESSNNRSRYTDNRSIKPKIIRQGYKRNPKRQEIEHIRWRYPKRNRVRYHANREKANSVDSERYECSSSGSLTDLTYNDDHCIDVTDDTSSVRCDYPYYFERIPSSYEYADDCNIIPESESHLESSDLPSSSELSIVGPPQRDSEDELSRNKNRELADEYEVIFENVEPKIKYKRLKKVVRVKPFVEQLDDSTLALSNESSVSSESVSSSSTEYEIVHQPRKYLRRNRFRNLTVIKKRAPPEYEIVHQPRKYVRRNRFRNLTVIKKRAPPVEEQLRPSVRKRGRKYIRVGSQKFQESTEKVVDYDFHHPVEKENSSRPTIKNTYSRGTSTEPLQLAEEKFTFYPPVHKDTYSRGTSTEILPLYAKRTSTSDLIKLIQAIGTNTEHVITRDTGIDPIPLPQKAPSVIVDVKSEFTNTEKINVRSMGIGTIPEKEKTPLVNKATDPLFYVDQKDKTTNTIPEKKKHIANVGTDPRPTTKLEQASKATDPLYYLGQQVKFTNTEKVITIDAQTETPKKPANVSKETTTTPVTVQDQKTSYDKVKTTSRGNNPIVFKMLDKGFQFDTVQHKPAVKTEFTETFTQLGVGKATQTSFIEKPKEKPSVYQVQTQTEKVQRKPPPSILKLQKPSISEELAVVEAEEPSSSSELSMHLVFEKCQEEVYKRRTNVCKARCSAYCDPAQRVVVCDNVRSKPMILNSLSDCHVSSIAQKHKSPRSEIELKFTKKKDPIMSNFTSEHDLQTVSKVQRTSRSRKPKLREECEISSHKNSVSKQNRNSRNNVLPESDEKNKRPNEASVFDSSYTTLTSCDWKNIAEKIKINN